MTKIHSFESRKSMVGSCLGLKALRQLNSAVKLRMIVGIWVQKCPLNWVPKQGIRALAIPNPQDWLTKHPGLALGRSTWRCTEPVLQRTWQCATNMTDPHGNFMGQILMRHCWGTTFFGGKLQNGKGMVLNISESKPCSLFMLPCSEIYWPSHQNTLRFFGRSDALDLDLMSYKHRLVEPQLQFPVCWWF